LNELKKFVLTIWREQCAERKIEMKHSIRMEEMKPIYLEKQDTHRQNLKIILMYLKRRYFHLFGVL